MKKNRRARKSKTAIVPQPRSLSRLIRQMFASLLKHQNFDHQNEVIQRLQDLESKIERMTRVLTQRAGRKG